MAKAKSAVKTTKTKKTTPKRTKPVETPAPVVVEESVSTASSGGFHDFLRRNRKWLLALLVLALAIGPSLFFYSKYNDAKKEDKEQQLQNLVQQVSEHVELPQNEKPVTATVSDVSKLANQPFFTHAQNGDKVLVYQKGNRAVLYRPSTDKIIEIRPYNAEPVAGAAPAPAAPTPSQ